MNRDVAFNLDKGGSVDQRLGLGVDCIGRVGFADGGDGLGLLLLLAFDFDIVKLDISSDDTSMRAIIGGLLFQLLSKLVVFLFVRWRDNTPAASPWHASAESDSDPGPYRNFGPLHHDIDVVEIFGLAGNQSASIGFLEDRMLIHGQSNSCCPLDKRLVRSEMQQVPILASGRKAENVLQRLLIAGSSGQRLDLQKREKKKKRMSVSRQSYQAEHVGGYLTTLSEASVRLMNLGRTSPSSPAASNSAASHKERTVPTSCAKDSVQVLSGFGLPSI